MDLTIALVKEINEKTGIGEDEIWNNACDYLRYEIKGKGHT